MAWCLGKHRDNFTLRFNSLFLQLISLVVGSIPEGFRRSVLQRISWYQVLTSFLSEISKCECVYWSSWRPDPVHQTASSSVHFRFVLMKCLYGWAQHRYMHTFVLCWKQFTSQEQLMICVLTWEVKVIKSNWCLISSSFISAPTEKLASQHEMGSWVHLCSIQCHLK